jgi:hypothetical protein
MSFDKTAPSKDASTVINFEWNSRIHALSKIRRVKYVDIRTAGIFSIWLSASSDDESPLIASIGDIFHHFAKRQIVWEALEVRVEYGGGPLSHSLTKSILNVANALNLFKRITIQDDECYESSRDDDETISIKGHSEYFLAQLAQSERLEVLEISVPRQMTTGDSRELCQLLENTRKLRELSFTLNAEFDVHSFCNSLERNATLEKFTLILGNYKLSDEALGSIMTALDPSLKELIIEGSDCFGCLSSGRLKSLLAASSSLSTLKLYGYAPSNVEKRARAEDLLKGLRKNKSLQHLVTSSALFDKLAFSNLVEAMRDCSSLKKVCLWEGNLARDDLEKVIQMDRLERPIEINLHNLSPLCLYNLTTTIEAVLEAHPELRLSIGPSYQHEPLSFQHACDLNWYGRYLLYQPKKTPLPLWSKVLERSNTKPSVIFELLKGPAFAGTCT